MVIQDVKNVQDIKDMRLTRLNETGESVKVKLTMVIVAAQYGNDASLDLTDFTRLYKGEIIPFRVKPNSDAVLNLVELKNAYDIREDDTKKKLQKSRNKVNFIDNGYIVLVTVDAEAYNGTTDAVFKLIGFKILNKGPLMIRQASPIQKMKVTSLIKEIETRPAFKKCQNTEEIQNIITVLGGGNANKKQKLDETSSLSTSQEQSSKQEATPPHFPVDPLFVKPANDYDTQIHVFTQNESSQDIFGTQQQQGTQDQIDAQLAQSMPRPQLFPLESISSDRNDHDFNERSSPLAPIKREHDTSTDEIPKGNEVSEEEAVQKEEHNNSIALDNKEDEEHNGTQEIMVEGKRNNVDTESDNEEGDQDEGSILNLESEVDPDKFDLIGQTVKETEIDLDTPLNFPGYIVGTDPYNFQVIGKPFQDLIRHTKFRLLITNFNPTLLKDLKLNTNCLALEFRSKQKILEFFGYDTIEAAYKDQQLIQDKLMKLREKRNKMKFSIVRKCHRLTLGRQLVWELEDGITIDNLLEM